ncbi:hypothetical protein C5167_024841 [Papaver somniferum]|uniref:Protein kinase domain-containing protein n=1 Tax=Papaver somniferum TaxID=3469 RepID=A0A4Y7JPQ4_PAPSO|nr:hypothetical protein C5167_024841 [Papaver somniferum]
MELRLVKVLMAKSIKEEGRDVLESRLVRQVSMMSRAKHANLVKKYLLSIRPKQLDILEAIGYAVDVARAMECLHDNGVIHKYLEPGSTYRHCSLWIEVITRLFRWVMTMKLKKSVKLDFDPAREESATDMMTAETET